MNKRFSGFLNLLSVIIISTMLLSSCSKEGSVGAEGPQGEKGTQGVQGADGSTILNGTGMPALTSGKIGDYYLDLSTTNLYGPKLATSWGNALSLKGAKGDAGTPGKDGIAGSQFLSGNGIPATTVGISGDFFFDKENLAMYGPKVNTSWGTPVSLKSANSLGVKVVLINNFKFTKKIDVVDDFSYRINQTIVPVADYGNYYESGLVILQFRDPRDPSGSWETSISMDATDTKDLPTTFTGYISVSHEDCKYDKNGINLYSYINASTNDWGGQNYDEQLKAAINKMINTFNFDIKIVLIPGTQVQILKQQGVNVNNEVTVLKHLNLSK